MGFDIRLIENLLMTEYYFRQEAKDEKLGILDVKVHTKSGKVIDIEIQVHPHPKMRERILFYVSEMITGQISRGDPYSTIKKVISIVITDFKLVLENEVYHNRYQLYDKNTKSTFTDLLEINTLELPKLPANTDNSTLWDWLSFLKIEIEEELSMLAEKSSEIKKAVGY